LTSRALTPPSRPRTSPMANGATPRSRQRDWRRQLSSERADGRAGEPSPAGGSISRAPPSPRAGDQPRPAPSAATPRERAHAEAPGESGRGRASGPAPTPFLGLPSPTRPRARLHAHERFHPARRAASVSSMSHRIGRHATSLRSTAKHASTTRAGVLASRSQKPLACVASFAARLLSRGQREIVPGSSAGMRVSSVTSGAAAIHPRAARFRTCNARPPG